MTNVQVTLEDKNTLVIKVDLTKEFGPSTSGKTMIVASTQGNAIVPDHPQIKFGLNVFKK